MGQLATQTRADRLILYGIISAIVLVVITAIFVPAYKPYLPSVSTPATRQPAVLQINSLKCLASSYDDDSATIQFSIYVSGMRTGTGRFSREMLGVESSDVEYPTNLEANLYAADTPGNVNSKPTLLENSTIDIPQRLEVGQKFETTDSVLYNPPPEKLNQPPLDAVYQIFEPSGCKGDCIRGILKVVCEH